MINRHLFLSPHYDDAVYSSGATIYQLTQSGQPVTILTVMAGYPRPPYPDTPIVRDNHTRWQAGDEPVRTRRNEDQRAAEILGATVIYLDHLDCIYRVSSAGDALYPDEDSLWGDIHPEDPTHTALINHPLELNNITDIYAPLGVGDHVDHQIVHQWGIWLVENHPHLRLWFYADFPYIRKPNALKQHLDQLTTPVTPHPMPITSDAINAKIRAVAAYQSQISTFWPFVDAISDDIRAIHRTDDGQFAEQFFRYSAKS